jgi:hypothetical protein
LLVSPMIGSWQPPRIERISSLESRRLAALPVAGLSGDLHQDLGRGAIAVEIVGSLVGDEARDDFLKELREKFLDGSPVDFVADIVKESKLEQVLIEELEFQESSAVPEVFCYRIVLREYTEPPEPPATELGAELDAALDLEAELGLDMLDLPAITADVPEVGDLLAPVKTAADSLAESLSGAGSLLTDFSDLFE